MPKKSGFTSAQEKRIASIKPGSGHTTKLAKLAKLWKKTEDAVVGKWYRTQAKMKNNGSLKNRPTRKPTVASSAPAIDFKIVKFDPGKRHLTSDEIAGMEKGLRNTIPVLKDGEAVSFPKRMVSAARVFLKKEYAGNIFVFYRDKNKSSNDVMLTKRS